jgi:hypothetical protein
MEEGMGKGYLFFLMAHIIKVILKQMRQRIKKEFLYQNNYNIQVDSYKIDFKDTGNKRDWLTFLSENMKKESELEEH